MPKLSITATNVLAYVAQELMKGFTGEITLHCNSGGVAQVVKKERVTNKELDINQE